MPKRIDLRPWRFLLILALMAGLAAFLSVSDHEQARAYLCAKVCR